MMTEDWRPKHVLEVRAESGEVYTQAISSDLAVARLALVRAVEEWFDTVITPAWTMAQLDSLPHLIARVR